MKYKAINLIWCDGVYVIVEDPNGPTVTNQTDGCSCGHPSTHGFVVPMPRTFDGMILDCKGFFNPSANYLNFPQKGSLEFYSEFLTANGFTKTTITSIREAWVGFSYVSDKQIKTAILTWKNSD